METEKANNVLRNSAHLYDFDNRDHLSADIPFYLSYGGAAKGGILELGCGTGRVALVMAQNGYSVTGLDLSKNMLAVFKDKLKNQLPQTKENIDVVCGDMSNFNLNKKFGLIIAPFRAFQALTKDDDITSWLSCIHQHLRNDGIFIINVFRPRAIMDESWVFGETVQWEHLDELSGRKIVKKHWGDKIDTVKQIIYAHYAFDVSYADGRFERIVDDIALKYYRYEQLKKLLTENGFVITEEFGWYDKSSIQNGRELIFVCKKENHWQS